MTRQTNHLNTTSVELFLEDEEQECCQLCDEEFGMLNRQHHCRYCGWLVCSDCSPEGQLVGVDRWVSSTEGHLVKHAAPGEGAHLLLVIHVVQRPNVPAALLPEFGDIKFVFG